MTKYRWVLPVLVVAALAYPLVRWAFGTTPKSADSWINRSLADYRAGRYADCIRDASEAIRLNAGLAQAHNNLAACQGASGNYDEEIRSAIEALRIDPNLQIAKANLEWAVNQKRRVTGR